MSLDHLGITSKNFMCFGDEPQGFLEFKPMNLIIGRNNSAKSTLLDLVGYFVDLSDLSTLGHRNSLSDPVRNDLQTASNQQSM